MARVKVEEELRALEKIVEILPEGVDDETRTSSHIIWHIIRLARHAEQRLEFEVHRPLGWSWAGYRIMFNTFVLGTAEPSQLADILRISRPTATSTIDKLERDGFLVRRQDPSNRRRTLVTLTDRGNQAVKAAAPMQLKLESQMASGLTVAERAALLAILNGLLKTITNPS
jgi:DNA-binding MarR family transcriptional regulator